MIRGSINLSKIDKEQLYVGKTGDKWLNITIWENDEPDKFDNTHAIKQSFSKEARDAGKKEPYIGNGKASGPKSAPKRQSNDDADF